MKLAPSLFSIMAFAFATQFIACSDDSSSSPSNDETSSSSSKTDCSETDEVVVVSPAGGETYAIGDTITVVYGTDLAKGGFMFEYRVDEDSKGVSLLEESAGPETPDGVTCYEQELVLSADLVEPSETAFIRVIPYYDQAKGANSGTFTVTE